MLRHIASPHHDDTCFSGKKCPWWHCFANLWSTIGFIRFVTLFPSYWLWKAMKYATIQPLLVHVLAIHHHRTVMKNHYPLFTKEFPSIFPHAPSKLQVQPRPPVPTTSWSPGPLGPSPAGGLAPDFAALAKRPSATHASNPTEGEAARKITCYTYFIDR